MNILYLGAFSPSSLIEKYPESSLDKYKVAQFIIDSLRKRKDCRVSVVTSPDVQRYPSFPVFYLRKYKDENLQMVSSLNIPIIRLFWTIITMIITASKVIRNENIEYVIIPYIVFRHVFVTRVLKHLFPKIKICVIIPDIFFPKDKAKAIMNRWANKHGRKSDFFVLYTDAMADYLSIRDKKYIVEEGFIDVSYFDSLLLSKPQYLLLKKKTIVYSGGLTKQYGILRLVEAIKYVNDEDCELQLYGNGDAVTEIKKAAKNDCRISYMGWAKKEDIFNILVSASVVVNPRAEKDGEFTQFSCPSKILEYLYSGTPTIACPLSGIPKEYYSHFILTDGSPKSLADAIDKAMHLSDEERKAMGKSNREFIADRMNIDHQCNRMLDMFKSKN